MISSGDLPTMTGGIALFSVPLGGTKLRHIELVNVWSGGMARMLKEGARE